MLISLCHPLPVFAVGSGPVRAPVVPRSAEAEYNRGLQNKDAKRFAEAVADFRRAVDLRENFPEAWNELGFALRQIGQYTDAVRAYDQALRLRPNYPEALEYLGETYVKTGRLDEARDILGRLRALDPARARELEAAIQAGK
jgi:tetratricopeptide (TPR) repeat protein